MDALRVFLALIQRTIGSANTKGKAMKASRIALLAGLGMIAMTLPAAAGPAVSGGTDVRTTNADLIQFAQLNPRQINEARGGDFKKAKKAKKMKKK